VNNMHIENKFLVIGDMCVDMYIYGDVERLNPEAPVPILVIPKEKNNVIKKYGMARNVAQNLSTMISGNDKISEYVETLFGSSSYKSRYIDRKTNYQLMRMDSNEESTPLNIDDIKKHDKIRCVIISDYNKGSLDLKSIIEIIKHFRKVNPYVRIFIDTKKTDLTGIKDVFIKINEHEFNLINKETLVGNHVIVTLGGRGSVYKLFLPEDVKNKELKGHFTPAKKVDVIDLCGAGDTFLAALAFWYHYYQDIYMALNFANNASAITVTKQGCYSPSMDEIMKRMFE